MIKKAVILTAVAWSVISLLVFSQERVISEYKIGPKDLLEISVVGLPELDKFKVRVEEDGTITLPLLGLVQVDGLSKTELERKLKELLEEKYVQDAQVTIFIMEFESKRVYVNGAVTNPGPYELLGRQTLMTILSQAGGLTNDAADKIIVYRDQPDGTSTSLHISVEDLYLNGDTSLNIPLEPNDVINVPHDKIVNVFVYGAVKNPGAIEVKMSKLGKFTLQQAIAAAGGFDERAAKGSVRYETKDDNGNTRKIKVNVKDIIKGKKKDIILKEGDIIFVPETIF